MKKQLQQLRRLFVRTKNYNASLARPVSHSTYDDEEDGGNRLSGAFMVVLLLHVVAVVGVFAFARIKENRNSALPPEPSTQTAASKAPAAKPAPPVAATAIAPAARPAPAGDSLKAPQAGPRPPHVVKPGETLGRIAFAYNVGVGDLVAVNKLKNQDDIQVGKALAIPENKPPARVPPVAENRPATPTASSQKPPVPGRDRKTTKTYIVRKGDTAMKIARENGCTYEELVKLNSIKDPKKIVPGQVLKVPAKNG